MAIVYLHWNGRHAVTVTETQRHTTETDGGRRCVNYR